VREERWVEVSMHEWVQRGYFDGEWMESRWSRVVIHRTPGLTGGSAYSVTLPLLFTLQQFCSTLNETFPECPVLEVEMLEGIAAEQPWRYFDV